MSLEPGTLKMSESQSPVLAVQDLNVHFAQEHGTLHAVRGLSFELFAGESLAIVGESGSGKSASAMAIMGLQPESARVEGSVVLHGTQLLSSTDQSMSQLRGKSIAMIFQDPLSAMTPVYTIGEQIIEAIQVHDNCSTESAKARAVELLDSVGIAEPHRRVNAYPHEFSGGMRQRALIAMAIANRPDVIIADEPTTALDVTIQAQVLEVLQRACRELNVALIMITHDLGVVARVADKAIVMYAGRAVEQGKVSTLFKRPLMPYTLGLLGSLPSLVGSAKYALNTIDGYPPSALDLPPGCSFAPRCPLVEDACKASEPMLMSTDRPDHLSACIQHELIARESLSHRDLFNAQESTEGCTRFQPVDREHVVLELKAVKKHYPLYEGAVFRRRVGTVHAVDGIDLHLCQRETLALVGESGCGKSTTALSILDLEEPTEGKIRIFGKDVAELQSRESRLQTRRQLQVVFQDPMSSLDPRMPIFDLIAEPLTVFDYQKKNIQQRVEQLLQLVGLDLSYAERYPQQLSGGQCQRVCIARALALEPQLLILDEPVSALDVSIRAGIINLLDRLKLSHGLAYLFIAHDLALVRHFADRVAIMYLGEIIETGSVDDVYENPSHPYTRCLLSLVPVPDPETERMRNRLVPRGELPSPANPPSGCRFNTRCLRKPLLGAEQQRHCEENSPELKAVLLSESTSDATFRDVHLAACHYPGIKLESS